MFTYFSNSVTMHRSPLCFICLKRLDPVVYYNPGCLLSAKKSFASKSAERRLEECYIILNIPKDSKQDAVRQAFLDLAKKYHPDSGSPEADMDKFVALEHAFRTLSKHNTGKSSQEEVESIVFDIKHTAPQHRQYLSFDGLGHGTPFQRQKQWAHARAQKAANNVMEHRLAKSMAKENTLMKKGQGYGKKHDIKTKYGLDRLVEDLIQESMSKGEFNNLKGNGKPLKDQNSNPYVDFTTHKLNEVLINNGFTPEWILISKEIDEDKQTLKGDLERERKCLGPYPLNEAEAINWDKICEENKYPAMDLNSKINKYNLIVPMMNKQKFHIKYDVLCEQVLKNGEHSVNREIVKKVAEAPTNYSTNNTDDIFGIFFKAVSELLTFERKK